MHSSIIFQMLPLQKLFPILQHIVPVQYKFAHSYIYKMNTAYMRRLEGSDVFELTFQYKNSELEIDRQFNFSRKLSESVNTFLSRVTVSVEKTLTKKQKKDKNKSKVDDKLPLRDKIHLYQNGADVSSDMLCEELFNIGGNICLNIIDQEYKVTINTPWIKNAVLPISILSNFPVYPSKFETIFTDKNLSEFTWFKSLNKEDWIKIGEGFLYTPTNDDLNSNLKIHCLPKNETDCGPIIEIISSAKVEANPGQCPSEIRHKFTQNKLSGLNFRVVTYNLLADLYADSDYSREVLFPYCPPYALQMDYRKQLILKELLGFHSDIICLQEVDDKVFINDLNPVLSFVGFKGIFHKKGGTLREGLAFFYDNNRFRLLDSSFVVLGEEITKNPLFSELWSKVSENELLVKRLIERTTTLQFVLLESIENNEILLVANTHFYFHPDADHIRVLQGAMSIIYLQDFKNMANIKYGKRVSLIFCGDFNSVPECGTYRLYTTGNIPEDIVDWKSNLEESIEGIKLTQNTILMSACGTPKYTNFTVLFKDCLDYIYCEKNSFEVTQVVPLPSDEELTAHIAIPSVLIPSDHLSLVADLKWCNNPLKI